MHKGFDDNLLITRIKDDNILAFEHIYDKYARKIFGYIYNWVNNRELCEDIVQEIFISLWAHRSSIEINSSLSAYLFKSAKNNVLSYMRSNSVHQKYAAHLAVFLAENYDDSNQDLMDAIDLQEIIDKSVSELPDRCQEVFKMSRYEHLPLAKIAEKMDISIRTVENYITKALKHLRKSLVNNYLS